MSKIFAVVAAALLLLTGAYAVGYAYEDGGERYSVDNETWTVDSGNYTDLEYSGIEDAHYTDRVTVRNENGTEAVEGVDYTWNTTNGTVKATSDSPRLDDGSDATIDYEDRVASETQGGIASLFAGVYELGGVFIFVMMVGVALAALFRMSQ